MTCSACRSEGPTTLIERHKRVGFSHRTIRYHLCPACAPAPVSPVGVLPAPVTPPRGAGAGAVLDPHAPTGAVVAAGGGFHSQPVTTGHMEGHADEVGIAESRSRGCFVNSPGRPGSVEGPGRLSPLEVVGLGAGGAA